MDWLFDLFGSFFVDFLLDKVFDWIWRGIKSIVRGIIRTAYWCYRQFGGRRQ